MKIVYGVCVYVVYCAVASSNLQACEAFLKPPTGASWLLTFTWNGRKQSYKQSYISAYDCCQCRWSQNYTCSSVEIIGYLKSSDDVGFLFLCVCWLFPCSLVSVFVHKYINHAAMWLYFIFNLSSAHMQSYLFYFDCFWLLVSACVGAAQIALYCIEYWCTSIGTLSFSPSGYPRDISFFLFVFFRF